MIDPQGWALVPGSEPMRFVAVDARYPAVRLGQSEPLPLRFGEVPAFKPAPLIVADRHVFAVPSIGWEGALFCADDDLDRLVHAMRVVERVILLLAWLRAKHEKPRRYATLQDLASVMDPGLLASVPSEQIDAAIKSAVETTPCTLPPSDFDRLVVRRAMDLLRRRWVKP